MKIADILKITPEDANKMSTQELYDAVWDLSRSVNKMRSGLIREGLDALSLQRLEKTGGRLSVMELDSEGKSTGVVKTRNKLLSELMRGLRFYRADDSSLTKQKAIMKAVGKDLKTTFDSLQQFSNFWESVRKIHEIAQLKTYYESEEEITYTSLIDYENLDIDRITYELDQLYQRKLGSYNMLSSDLEKKASRMFSANK